MATTKSETIYKPKYNGRMRFAMILYPVWLGLFLYFFYQVIVTRSYNPQGFLAVIFGSMTISLPFRVFREVRFRENIIVKRYLLPDLVIEYKDITSFDKMSLSTPRTGISIYMLMPHSLDEFERIVHSLMSSRKIKLKKK